MRKSPPSSIKQSDKDVILESQKERPNVQPLSQGLAPMQVLIIAMAAALIIFGALNIQFIDMGEKTVIAISEWQSLLAGVLGLLAIVSIRKIVTRKRVPKRWSAANVAKLNELSSRGEGLDVIARTLSTSNDLVSEQSVRSKLVSLGQYKEYQESYWRRLERDYQKHAEKRGVPSESLDVIQDAYVLDENFVRLLINQSEQKIVEFKESFNYPRDRDDHASVHQTMDVELNHAVIKSIAAFLNTVGGYLVIGVKDTPPHKIVGLFNDKFEGQDLYIRRLNDKIQAALGKAAMTKIGIKICKLGPDDVCLVSCKRSNIPVFCNDTKYNQKIRRLPKKEAMAKRSGQFYLRQDKGVAELEGRDAVRYIAEHFSNI